jgi:hypothetical protein
VEKELHETKAELERLLAVKQKLSEIGIDHGENSPLSFGTQAFIHPGSSYIGPNLHPSFMNTINTLLEQPLASFNWNLTLFQQNQLFQTLMILQPSRN